MVNGSRFYRALESISIASALSTALYHLPMPDPSPSTLTVLNSNFLQHGRMSGGRPQQTVYPRRLPVNCDTQTALAGIEPANFRLLVRCATSSATETTTVPLTEQYFIYWRNLLFTTAWFLSCCVRFIIAHHCILLCVCIWIRIVVVVGIAPQLVRSEGRMSDWRTREASITGCCAACALCSIAR